MSLKHRTAEYQRNARTIRSRVRAAWRAGRQVSCWRCRGVLVPGAPFDVGHLPGALASALAELAPEHRHRTGRCEGNRAAGGRVGAAHTNRRHVPAVPSTNPTTWAI